MFHSGVRPAVNPGISVSRVGGSAQIKAMKKVSGKLRLELAQYRELAAFAQFGSELDKETAARLAQGERILEILKQPQYRPVSVENQVMMIYAVTNKYLTDIEVEQVRDFEEQFLEFANNQYAEIGKTIVKTGKLEGETEEQLKAALEEFKKKFLAQ